MEPTVRIYESEQQARGAAAGLAEEGFSESSILLLTPMPGEEEAAIRSALRSAVEAELLPGSHINVCTRSLQQGRSVVAVRTLFGQGVLAESVLEHFGPVDTDELPPYYPRNSAPLSELFGIPTLTSGTTFGKLVSSSFALSSAFGLGLLSRNAAPLSSLLRMKTLTAPKRPWTSSLGLPLLSNNPAPLSSMLGMKTLSAPKKPWTTSFGFRLLSDNPAPLSDYLGIRVLSKRRKRRD